MGKLNRKINAKLGKEKKIGLHRQGLSNSLLSKKASLSELTSENVSVLKNLSSPRKEKCPIKVDCKSEKKADNFSNFVANFQTKKSIKQQYQTSSLSKISKKENVFQKRYCSM